MDQSTSCMSRASTGIDIFHPMPKLHLQASGVAEPSILGAILQDHELTSSLAPEERDKCLKDLAIVLYGGEYEEVWSRYMHSYV
jgi:hypothetical protein